MLFSQARTAAWLGLAGAATRVLALGQQQIIGFSGSEGAFQMASSAKAPGQILVSSDDYWGVIRAAGDLATDFGRVTGTNFTLSNGVKGAAPAAFVYNPVNNMNNTYYTTTGTDSFLGPAYSDPSPADTVIIAGTVGNSSVIDSLVASNKIDVSAISGQWEAFVSQVVENPIPGCALALVIAGSDSRGTIFGIYDVSEQIGVSPWYFWADVPTVKNENIFVLAEKKVQVSPSVKYRGLFLNDEQPALTDWVATNYPDTPYGAGYGAAFYSLVMELILRLRGNYLWPAVWGSMFEVDDPMNQPLACAYEIVLGSSHTEPLMRAQNEFATFYTGPWAYNLNNATINSYFEYGVQRAKPYARNSLWSMGMRGTGDSALEDIGPGAIVGELETLVANQRTIISEGLGVDILTVPQMWCLYKEVMSYIFEGLQVPEDITLLWSDDNWGNIRRFPLSNETSRPGGAGVYYHFDYVGDPRNYKWINTIQLSKTAEQMQMAYQLQADRIWILNVGDLKPLEVPISHFMDIAYDAPIWGVDNTTAWANAWAARAFGPGLATEISDIMMTYGMYAARRKYELIEAETYSVLNYHEGDAVLEQWATLAAKTQAVYDQLPAAYQPAFFEMVLHPVLAGQIVNNIYIKAAYNALYAGQQRNAANDVINQVLAYSNEDANLTMTWNMLLDGKWNHMMDQTHLGYEGYWQQPMRNSLPAMTYVQTNFVSLAGQVGVGIEGSNATVQGDDQWHTNGDNDVTLPPMDPYGPATRYFDVFSRGTTTCLWEAAPWVPWVKLSQYSGTVGPNGTDTRVYISIDWSQAPAAPNSTTVNINITTPCRALDKYGYSAPILQLPVNSVAVPSNFTQGFVESDGHVAIDGADFQTVVAPATTDANNTGVEYHVFASYGRTSSGVGLYPPTTPKLALAEAPALEYDLYLYTANITANVTVLISPSLNYLGDATPLEYAVSLFPASGAGAAAAAASPTLVTPVGVTVGANMPDGWGYAVGDAVWGLEGNYTTSGFDVPQEGAYKLRIAALMPSIIVQKIIIDTGGLRPSYLGPPESFLVGRDKLGVYNGTSFLNDAGTI